MKIKPLSQADKDALTGLARSMALRADRAGPRADTPPPATAPLDPMDRVRALEERVEAMGRDTNARLTRFSGSIELIERRLAGLEGDYQALRAALTQLDSRVGEQDEGLMSAMSELVQELESALRSEIDRLAATAADTATVQRQMADMVDRLVAAPASR